MDFIIWQVSFLGCPRDAKQHENYQGQRKVSGEGGKRASLAQGAGKENKEVGRGNPERWTPSKVKEIEGEVLRGSGVTLTNGSCQVEISGHSVATRAWPIGHLWRAMMVNQSWRVPTCGQQAN